MVSIAVLLVPEGPMGQQASSQLIARSWPLGLAEAARELRSGLSASEEPLNKQYAVSTDQTTQSDILVFCYQTPTNQRRQSSDACQAQVLQLYFLNTSHLALYKDKVAEFFFWYIWLKSQHIFHSSNSHPSYKDWKQSPVGIWKYSAAHWE